MKNIWKAGLLLLIITNLFSCNNDKKGNKAPIVYKGLYSFGPEVRSFKNCETGQEFWAVDSSAKLELGYSQQSFEKPYEPIYVEIEGIKIKSGPDGAAAEFDSTIIVKKVIKLTKEIPQNMCN